MRGISTILKIVKMTKSLSDWTNKNVEILFSRPRVEKIYRNLGFLKVSGGCPLPAWRRLSEISSVCPPPISRLVGAPRLEAIVRNLNGLPSAHLSQQLQDPNSLSVSCPKNWRCFCQISLLKDPFVGIKVAIKSLATL